MDLKYILSILIDPKVRLGWLERMEMIPALVAESYSEVRRHEPLSTWTNEGSMGVQSLREKANG